MGQSFDACRLMSPARKTGDEIILFRYFVSRLGDFRQATNRLDRLGATFDSRQTGYSHFQG
jgi:hypothetical protein